MATLSAVLTAAPSMAQGRGLGGMPRGGMNRGPGGMQGGMGRGGCQSGMNRSPGIGGTNSMAGYPGGRPQTNQLVAQMTALRAQND